MNWEAVAAIAAIVVSVISCGGVCICVGKFISAIDWMKKGLEAALEKIEKHDEYLTDIKERISVVETRQDDCKNCP